MGAGAETPFMFSSFNLLKIEAELYPHHPKFGEEKEKILQRTTLQ
jgi:hypothetical protein